MYRSGSIPTGGGRSFAVYIVDDHVFAMCSTLCSAFSLTDGGFRGFRSRRNINAIAHEALRKELGLKGKVRWLDSDGLNAMLDDRLAKDEAALNGARQAMEALLHPPALIAPQEVIEGLDVPEIDPVIVTPTEPLKEDVIPEMALEASDNVAPAPLAPPPMPIAKTVTINSDPNTLAQVWMIMVVSLLNSWCV
jgi:hypothetical protein